MCWCWWFALIAFGKEPKGVNLFDEVCHAGPPSESKSNDKYPHHNKCVHHVHCGPAREEERRFLRCILHERGWKGLLHGLEKKGRNTWNSGWRESKLLHFERYSLTNWSRPCLVSILAFCLSLLPSQIHKTFLIDCVRKLFSRNFLCFSIMEAEINLMLLITKCFSLANLSLALFFFFFFLSTKFGTFGIPKNVENLFDIVFPKMFSDEAFALSCKMKSLNEKKN